MIQNWRRAPKTFSLWTAETGAILGPSITFYESLAQEQFSLGYCSTPFTLSGHYTDMLGLKERMSLICNFVIVFKPIHFITQLFFFSSFLFFFFMKRSCNLGNSIGFSSFNDQVSATILTSPMIYSRVLQMVAGNLHYH